MLRIIAACRIITWLNGIFLYVRIRSKAFDPRANFPKNVYVGESVRRPAHLHIDLLPEHQGAGHGRELMRVFLGALAERGVGAVHLGVSNQNVGAQRFYARLGFHRIDAASDADVTFLGRSTDVPL